MFDNQPAPTNDWGMDALDPQSRLSRVVGGALAVHHLPCRHAGEISRRIRREVLRPPAATRGKYRAGYGEKFFGRLPRPSTNRPRVWFHAVSVGEVLQLETVLNALRKIRGDLEFVISTTTRTGLDVARKKFPGDVVCYF